MKPHKILSSTFLFFCMVGLFACESKSPRPTSATSSTSPTAKNFGAATHLLKGVVTCLNGNCPEAVGLVQIDFGTSLQQCTSFLTAGDILVTNSHCLPDSLVTGASCQGKLKVTFPEANGHKVESASCRQIIQRTALTEQNGAMAAQLDLAFVRLNRTINRTPFIVDASPLADGTQVTVFKINPSNSVKGVVSGILEAARFTTTTYTVGGQNPYLSLVRLEEETKIPQGNSGSPVVDDQGHVRAILQGPVILNGQVGRDGFAKAIPCLPDLMSCL